MRTLEDIRSNLDFVGCDNQTALDLCDEVERLRSRVEKLREALKEFDEFAWTAVKADCEEARLNLQAKIDKARAILKETEQQQ